MRKVLVYYGPKDEFEKELPPRFITLTELVYEYDKNRRNPKDSSFLERNINTMVAYSDAYAGVTQGAIQSFTSILGLFDIDNMYLQNPPNEIFVRMQELYGPIMQVKHYKYRAMTMGALRMVNRDFESNIIGQPDVKKKLLMHLYPMVSRRHTKPLIIMFFGPSGVGKTETAKFLARVLRQELFRKQMSMFHTQTFVNYLFGNEHSGNSFAKELLERKSNVILLDEFDKMPELLYSAFYQLFDEGVFVDQNYELKLERALIICTSNFQSLDEIRRVLGDPIFYRFDAFVKFGELSDASVRTIIDNELNAQYARLAPGEKAQIDLESIREMLHTNTSVIKNVRQVSHSVAEILSYAIIKNMFGT